MQNPDISFVQLKIANIGTALCYCGDGSPLPYSTYVITALKSDEEGFIWFFINKGRQQISNNDARPFPVHLDFYRKGYPFSMKIEGEGRITDANEKIHDLMGKGIRLQAESLAGIVLVKVKMEKVEYKELSVRKPFQPLNSVSAWLKNIVHPAQETWQPSPLIS